MSGYLDKEAVLDAAITKRTSFPAYTFAEFEEAVKRGEFDAKPPAISQWQLEQYNIAHEKAVAEKDAEIVRLNNIWNAHHSKCDERFSILSREHDNTIILVQKLKDRIAQQDQELKDLGEALRKSEKAVKCDGCHPKPCSGCRWENERCKYRPYAKGDHSCRYFEEPPKDEPELMICPNAGSIAFCGPCDHSRPHEKTGLCSNVEAIENLPDPECKRPCIPYKKEPTLPQGQQEKTCKTCKHPTCPQRTTSSNAYQICVPRGDFVDQEPEETRGQPVCPGSIEAAHEKIADLAKDIDDLTLRMDNLENMERQDRKRIENLEQKRLMDDSRGNTFEGQIDRLEDALKSLKEEVAALEKRVK